VRDRTRDRTIDVLLHRTDYVLPTRRDPGVARAIEVHSTAWTAAFRIQARRAGAPGRFERTGPFRTDRMAS